MSDLVNRSYLTDLLGLSHEDRSLSNVESLGDALAELSLATDLVKCRYQDQRMENWDKRKDTEL